MTSLILNAQSVISFHAVHFGLGMFSRIEKQTSKTLYICDESSINNVRINIIVGGLKPTEWQKSSEIWKPLF